MAEIGPAVIAFARQTHRRQYAPEASSRSCSNTGPETLPMCFSAPASFVTVAFTAAAGASALIRVIRRQDLAFAAAPLFFASQQAIEGLLWLRLPGLPAER